MKDESASKKIDNYIEDLPDLSKKIVSKLRKIIHKANPEIEEEWKWNSPAYSYKSKIMLETWGFKKHASIIFFHGSLMKDSRKAFNYGKKESFK